MSSGNLLYSQTSKIVDALNEPALFNILRTRVYNTYPQIRISNKFLIVTTLF